VRVGAVGGRAGGGDRVAELDGLSADELSGGVDEWGGEGTYVVYGGGDEEV
jgi:hypothetical protein